VIRHPIQDGHKGRLAPVTPALENLGAIGGADMLHHRLNSPVEALLGLHAQAPPFIWHHAVGDAAAMIIDVNRNIQHPPAPASRLSGPFRYKKGFDHTL